MIINLIENDISRELFGAPFELIDSAYSAGQENMDFDYKRTIDCAEGKALPMFRLYGWKPWAVSLGANQKLSDINEQACRERGFDIVRRPTGGRAVLHANELTYSVVMKLPENKTVHDIYRDIHIILLKGLSRLGFGGDEAPGFEKSQPDFRDFYKSSGVSVSCFASSARYEISFKGRKIVGSAQRLFGSALLQHGSIILGPGHEQLAFVTKEESPERQRALLEYINGHSSSLEEAAGRPVAYREAADALIGEINYK